MVTTDKHFQWFKEAINKWMKIYDIGGWVVYFAHQEVDGGYAACQRR